MDGTADLAVGLLHLDPSPDALAAVDAMIPWEPRVAHALIDAGVVKRLQVGLATLAALSPAGVERQSPQVLESLGRLRVLQTLAETPEGYKAVVTAAPSGVVGLAMRLRPVAQLHDGFFVQLCGFLA